MTNVATSRLAAATSTSWLDFLNFMRIFRNRGPYKSPSSIRFEFESRRVSKGGRARIRLFSLRLRSARNLTGQPACGIRRAPRSLTRTPIYQAPRRLTLECIGAGCAQVVKLARSRVKQAPRHGRVVLIGFVNELVRGVLHNALGTGS